MGILKYILKRLVTLIPVLFGITILAFVLGICSPGDPVEAILNPDGTQIVREEDYKIVRERLGLDDPIPVQYVKWLTNAVTGDFGKSFFSNKEIREQMEYRLPYTMRLACFGMALTLLLSIPGFWLAILMILIFSEKLHWLPTSGLHGFSSYIMPGITVAVSTIGVCARLTRTTILDEIGKQYITVAASKGMNAKMITLRHAFRNSLIPITTFLGNYFAGILGGSTVAEVIFNIPGIGSYAIAAVQSRDYYVVQAYVLFTGLVYVIMTLIIDFLYLVINPKIRVGES